MEYMNCPFFESRLDIAWPLTFQNKSVEYNLKEGLQGIKDSVADEKEDELFYDFLISKAGTEKEKQIIEAIRDDERIHNQILRKVFTEISGAILPQSAMALPTTSFDNMTYIDGLYKAFMGELGAVEKYRKILAFMPNKELKDMLMYILTDEMKHAIKYNYLMMIAK